MENIPDEKHYYLLMLIHNAGVVHIFIQYPLFEIKQLEMFLGLEFILTHYCANLDIVV